MKEDVSAPALSPAHCRRESLCGVGCTLGTSLPSAKSTAHCCGRVEKGRVQALQEEVMRRVQCQTVDRLTPIVEMAI